MVILLSESFRMQDQDQEFNGMLVRIPVCTGPPSTILACAPIHFIVNVYIIYALQPVVWRAWVCDFYFLFYLLKLFFLFARSYIHIIIRGGTHARAAGESEK